MKNINANKGKAHHLMLKVSLKLSIGFKLRRLYLRMTSCTTVPKANVPLEQFPRIMAILSRSIYFDMFS